MNLSELTSETVTELLESILEQGTDIVNIAAGHYRDSYRIRIYIDRKGGISIDACTTLLKKLRNQISEQGWDIDSIHLEVSSPPSDWPLKTVADFNRKAGQRVRVRYVDDDTDNISVAEGIIQECSDEQLRLSTKKQEIFISMDSIREGKVLFQL